MSVTRKPIVAIDGPAGAGKSTVAKALAQALGYLYIDTGAMYRAVTLAAMRQGLDLVSAKEIEELAGKIKLEFISGKIGAILMNGENVSEAIRSPEVTRNVSAYVASYPGVRRVMVAAQQAMGKNGGIVMEGRDVTTVVFPDAELKVYLCASQEVRAKRRYEELKSQGREQPFPELLADLKRRDLEDLNRPGGALKQVADALMVDSTTLGIEEVVDLVLAKIVEGKG